MATSTWEKEGGGGGGEEGRQLLQEVWDSLREAWDSWRPGGREFWDSLLLLWLDSRDFVGEGGWVRVSPLQRYKLDGKNVKP